MKQELQPREGRYYFRGDRQIWIIVFLLMLISVVEVYSTTFSLAYRRAGGDTFGVISWHVAFLALGVGMMFLFQMIPIGRIAKFAMPMLVVSFFVLLFTLLFAPERNTANRWVELFGKSVQPSEFVKIPLILYLAYILAKKQKELKNFSFVVVNLFVVVAVICGVIVTQDFSTALLLAFVSFVVMWLGRVPRRYLISVSFLSVFVLSALLWVAPKFSESLPARVITWRNRIERFVSNNENNAQDARDKTWQSQCAKTAIANGLLWGKGPGNGIEMLTLPESYADFIFAALVEEGGLIGAIVVMVLYLWLMLRIYFIMQASQRPYNLYLCAGFGLLISIQAFIHICISVGLMPVTGQTLPLVSKGGSSIVATCIALGIIQNVVRQQKKELYEGEKQDAV